jgi:hypothetical protein
VGDGRLQSEICKLINAFWNKEELPDQWNESHLAIYKRETVLTFMEYHCCQHKTDIFHPSVNAKFICR